MEPEKQEVPPRVFCNNQIQDAMENGCICLDYMGENEKCPYHEPILAALAKREEEEKQNEAK